MKWQKNTGVMPCKEEQQVKVRLRCGEDSVGKARLFRWQNFDSPRDITHYVIGEVTFPDFDYVEPKVWTVELDDPSDAHFSQHGEFRFSIINDTYRMWQEVLTALNAMEERNG